jgi:hypothetical protein
MLRALRLLLPALLPSWNFFDVIGPSPRIHYQWLDEQLQALAEWREFRPRPAHVSLPTLLRRLPWNAPWNETLFLMSCAERIVQDGNARSEAEILTAIVRDWRTGELRAVAHARHVRFRLVFVHRVQQQFVQEVLFESRSVSLPDAAP